MEKNELKLQYLPAGVCAEEYLGEWDAYFAERNIERRNRLAEWNMGLVCSVAKSFRKKFADRIEMEDLVGYGMIGLLEAIERYDPTFEAGFGSFAVPRIVGSIWAGIEKWIGIPRRLFRKKYQVEMANEIMRQRLQREPNDSEMAEYLEMRLEDYRRLQRQIASQTAESYDVQELSAPGSFEEECEKKYLIEQIFVRFWQLSCEERQVLRWVFEKGYSLRKISEKQGVSRWKVQRLYDRALRHLSNGIL